MSEPIDELVLKISADVQGLKAGMQEIAGLTQDLASKTKGHGESMAMAFFKAEVAVHALEHALHMLKDITVDYVKEAYENIEAQDKMAQKLGVTNQFVAALQLQSIEAGMGVDGMSNAILHMERSLGKMTTASSETTRALEDLNLTVDDLHGKNPEEQYMKIVEAMGKMKDQSKLVETAQALFGRQGLQVVGVLKQGTEGYKEAADMARKYGYAVDEFDAAKIKQANDAWKEVHIALQGIANTIAIELAPYIQAIGEYFRDAATQGDGWGETIHNVIVQLVKIIDGFRAELRGLQILWEYIKLGAIAFGEGVVVAVDTAVRSVKYVGEILGNFGRALSRTSELIAQAFKSGFTLAMAGVEAFASDALRRFGDMLLVIHQGMMLAHVKGADEVLNASNRVRNAANEMKTDASRSAKDTAIAFKNAADDAGYAWSHIMPEWNGIKTGMEPAIAAMKQMTVDAWTSLNEVLNKPFDLHAVEDWTSAFVAKINAIALKVSTQRKTDMQAEHTDSLQKQAWDKQTWDQKLGYATSTMNSLGELMMHGSKKQFEIGKKLQLAAAFADVAAGIAKTFQQFGFYALLGPAEAVAAAGAVQIQRIAGMQYGGGGGGGGVSVGGGGGASAAAAAPTGVSGQTGGGQTITVALQGAIFNDQAIRGLVGQVNEFIRDGGQLAGLQVQQ